MNNEIACIKKMKNFMKYKFYICDNQLHCYMCIYVGYSSCSIYWTVRNFSAQTLTSNVLTTIVYHGGLYAIMCGTAQEGLAKHIAPARAVQDSLGATTQVYV